MIEIHLQFQYIPIVIGINNNLKSERDLYLTILHIRPSLVLDLILAYFSHT